MCARNERSGRCSDSEIEASGKSGHRRTSSRPRSSSRQRSSSRRARSVHRRPSTADSNRDDKRGRSRSSSTRRTNRASATPPKKEFDTPFDSNGRCHHHQNMQLARKKLTGGWKVLIDNCPKCLEDKYITKSSSDNRTVSSRRSRSRSARSNGERSKSPHSCGDHKSSSRSVIGGGSSCDSSRLSNRSTRSSRSVLRGGMKILSLYKKEERHPFDDEGYCHRHSNVRLAKRKFTGGWKILLDRCNECVADEKDSKLVSSRRSRSKSVCSRSSRHDDRRRHLCRLSDATSEVEAVSASNSSNHKKKSVKKMNYTDDTGKEGFYSGYVNNQYKPHGRGAIGYQDGTKYNGTWIEGSKVHGKTTDAAKGATKHMSRKVVPTTEGPKESVKEVSKEEFEDSDDFERQWEHERRNAKHCAKVEDYANLNYTSAKVVKDLPFIDLSGDEGKYTGEVNDKLLPHGHGCLTYNHGLVQDGKWENGFLYDDSTAVC